MGIIPEHLNKKEGIVKINFSFQTVGIYKIMINICPITAKELIPVYNQELLTYEFVVTG